MPFRPKATPQQSKETTTLADKLASMGLHTDLDLALHLPLRYEDLSYVDSIIDAPYARPVQIEGVVRHVDIQHRPRKQLLARLADETGEIFLRFINFYPSTVAQLQSPQPLRAYGELRHGFFGTEMVHPRISRADKCALPDSLTPVYSSIASISQAVLRRHIEAALATIQLVEILPKHWVNRLQLPSLMQALTVLHHPPASQSILPLQDRTHPAWRRVQFEELLAQQLSLKKAHQQRILLKAPALLSLSSTDNQQNWVKQLLQQLPFQLTRAQVRVWHEIKQDLAKPYPMNRLLQGDVGSGKTIIAALACLQANNHGLQAAFMAPTEILAEQHYQRLHAWLTPLGLRILWLTGSLSKKAKHLAHEKIATGDCDLIVGTHALIQDSVQFKSLGMVVVDEQHRFGVAQRLHLRGKGIDGLQPHVLMMSATPIPRTLAMTYLADLDVSVIDELPPGRTPIQTIVMASNKRHELSARIIHWLAQGKQAYWVCPLIEDSEYLQAQTATDTHLFLSDLLQPFSIGLVHGQMKANEKATVMAQFVAGTIHLLVATTVIEVGVDVPNASLMVIENAERFGLAQLHQLRGRVGRGVDQSICVLLYGDKVSAVGRTRLNVMRGTTDGFLIAEKDLELRGPGEFLGARQSGLGLLRFSDAKTDAAWIHLAQTCADDLLHHYPDAAQAMLNRWMALREQYLNA
jgi:ATP-dependent DNA helicase RecG